jgi:protein phosphatase 1G
MRVIMGNYLSKPNKQKKTLTGESHKVTFGSSEMQGWRVAMEDARLANLALDESTMIFGIFDGHGGREVSEYVSRHFCFSLLNSASYNAGNLSQALVDTFLDMDQQLMSEKGAQELIRIAKGLPANYPVKSRDVNKTVGCTAVVALIRDKFLFVANAGDSRCVINRGGVAMDLSIDHKPKLAGEKQRIIAAGGEIIDGRINHGLNLSRSIGDFGYKSNRKLERDKQLVIARPEVTMIEIQENDKFIVMACDGIWERMSSQECVEVIDRRFERDNLGSICEEVMERCIAPKVTYGLGCDNMTIIIVGFKHGLGDD